MAQAVLRLRALQDNGHWERYLRFHLQRESILNYSDPGVEREAA